MFGKITIEQLRIQHEHERGIVKPKTALNSVLQFSSVLAFLDVGTQFVVRMAQIFIEFVWY